MSDEADASFRKYVPVFCAIVCVGLLFWAVAAMSRISDGQEVIVKSLGQSPRATRTIGTEYTGVDGNPYRVTVTSDPGETAESVMARFESDLKAAKERHPERR